MFTKVILGMVLLLASAAVPVGAQAADSGKLMELERKIDVLAIEMERLKLGDAAGSPELGSVHGFGPAASKVYKKGAKRVSIGGYGEMHYTKYGSNKEDGTDSAKTDVIDLHRAIIYIGYKFNDWITFNSEIEFEHAHDKLRGEVEVEFAALDFKPWGDYLGIRTGLMLVPVGLSNEMHEPPVFHGVERPNVEKNIYPSTWREGGVGVFGDIGMVSYKSYLLAGLQAYNSDSVSGFKGSSGIRSGRSSGSKSLIADVAWVTRVDVEPVEGVSLGGTIYVGEADQNLGPQVPVTFWDLHATAKWHGLEGRALYVQGKIGNTFSLNTFAGQTVGKDLFGGYLEVAFDVLSLFPAKNHYLAPFFRYERYDTQKGMMDGFAKNPANSRVEYTMGLTYKPIPKVVIKFDHQVMRNQASTGIGQTNVGVGYLF